MGCGVGALACAILVANNLRDIPTDVSAGKRTLAVLMGDGRSRRLYVLLHAAAVACLVAVAALETWWALLGLASLPVAWRAVRAVRRSATGVQLIPVLRDTGLAELIFAGGAFVGFVAGAA